MPWKRPPAPRLEWAARQLDARGRLSDVELGRLYHADLGKHSETETCEYCAPNGGQLLARLIAQGKATPVSVVAE